MSQLTKAHDELFRRGPDESFSSLAELQDHCLREKQYSADAWQQPQTLAPQVDSQQVSVSLDGNGTCRLNDWSFTQLCRMARVAKDTINRLSPDTACLALEETLPRTDKPIQLLSTGKTIRSIHGVAYTRLWNADLLDVVGEFATDFQPPQTAVSGGTGLYCGEQDLFCFLIDPAGWTEINGEAFAPGLFLWNSEVGRRSLGVQTFWFQAVCQNHLVWDACEIIEFARKHTANVHDGLAEICRIIESLAAKRDERRDRFVDVVRKAMTVRLGRDADEALKILSREGVPRGLAKKATEVALQHGALTIFAVVDALTRLTQEIRYAGDRVEIDAKAASLLSLAT